MQDLGCWFLNDVCGIKSNPMPILRGALHQRPRDPHLGDKEKGARYTFNHQRHEVTSTTTCRCARTGLIPICTGEERLKDPEGKKVHSTQKPEALLYRCCWLPPTPGRGAGSFFGRRNHRGSAKKLGRRWIGIERDPRYMEAARHASPGWSQPQTWIF